MNDLISRQAALDNAWQVMYKDEWHISLPEQVVSVNDIEALPTIDAVPVVRCKDCKHRDEEKGFCEGRGWPMQLVPDDGFCDKGERSEDDTKKE